MNWLTGALLVTVFALSISSLLTYRTQNKILVQCQERQARVQERFDGLVRTVIKQQHEISDKHTGKTSAQTTKVIAFLSEVLGSRENKRKSDFETLLNECRERSTAANISFASQLASFQTRLSTALGEIESSKSTIQSLRAHLKNAEGAAANATAEKCAQDPKADPATERLLRERLDQAIQRIEKLKAEVKQLKAERKSESSFFSELDQPLPEKTLPSYPPQKETPVEVTKKPSSDRDPDCEKESFVFNSKRSGVAYAIHTATSANRCKRLCASEDLCIAWTFVSDTSECLLHRDPGKIVIADCCVSGTKCS